MIAFLAPAWLSLAIPLLWLVWRFPSARRSADILRTLAGLAFIAALSRPYLEFADPGRSLVLLVDRSLSMPAGSEATALETVRLIEDQRKAGDRLGVLSFGVAPKLERLPSETLRLASLDAPIDPGGTDLAAAITMGLESIPAGAQGSLLILSDGESTGRDPLIEARRAAARGIRIDILPQTRAQLGDLSVERFELPAEVDIGEPFQFEAWVFSDEAAEREVVLRRDGRIISRAKHKLERGMNRLVFRDILLSGGVASYSLDVATLPGSPPDRRPENDHGLAAVRALAPPAVLLLNEDGAPDTISQTLTAAGIPVDVRAPDSLTIDRLALTAYRAVILENVGAGRLGYAGMQALSDLVVERGGGLWMTGGHASFGIGGYHLSPLDELLPVSMEMRQESRKLGVAIAFVLDRSGSMSMSVAGGQTKMDLANAGTAAAIDMLSGIDSIAVIAVDSSPHVMVPLQAVDDLAAIKSRVLRIQSQGGGIYTYTGLLAAGQALEDAPQQNRHIILFADAADAEEPEGVPDLLDRFRSLGITVSVIALGTESDSDAEFLFQVAEDGDGDIYFTTEPAELPRLFAQDTMTMARSTFIEAPTPTRGLPGLFAMGEFGIGAEGSGVPFPAIEGYNLTYARPGVNLGAQTIDENSAPLFAFAQRGVGRVAALTGQVGGTFGAGLIAWPELPSLIVSTTRYLLGAASPEDLFATAQLEGNQVLVRLEADPTGSPDTSKLDLHMTLGDGTIRTAPLTSVGAGIFEARLPITTAGVALGSVHLSGGRVLELPPVALPYSPEFRRVPDPDAGVEQLKALARATGGGVLANLAQAFDGPRASRHWRIVTPELLLLGLLLLLFEIATRRLDLFDSAFARKPAQALARSAGRLRLRRAQPKRRPQEPQTPPAEVPPSRAPKQDAPLSMPEALERARQRANKRLDR